MRILAGLFQGLIFGPGARYYYLGVYDRNHGNPFDKSLAWSSSYKRGISGRSSRYGAALIRRPWRSPLLMLAVVASGVLAGAKMLKSRGA